MVFQSISRREFVIDSAAMVGFASGMYSKLLSDWDAPHSYPAPIQYLSETGANLLIYFINARQRHDYLAPTVARQKSFMVVQVPPQSLHEEFHYDANDEVPSAQMRATLSGPSFLVFELWPKRTLGSGGRPLPQIRFDIESFLDWTDADRFALQTADDAPSASHWHALPGKDSSAIVTLAAGGYPVHDLTYYRGLVDTVLAKPPANPSEHWPTEISIFEFPAGMLMVPIDAARADGSSAIVIWRAVQNRRGKRRGTTIHEQRCVFRDDAGRRITRSVTERWATEISVNRTTFQDEKPTEVTQYPPALRAIGLVDRFEPSGKHEERPEPKAPVKYPKPEELGHYLPTLVDADEVVFLNQLGQDAYRSSKFDIKVDGPFRLTDLGGSFKFRYRNHETKGLPRWISLVEYEHHFEAGRDNYIKVARIGLNPCTMLKQLHVAIAKRRIVHGVSYLEYKEYCEPLEPTKSFPDLTAALAYKDGYACPLDPTAPSASRQTRPLRYPFSRIDAAPGRSEPIEPVGLLTKGDPPADSADRLLSDRKYLDPRCFWVYKEDKDGSKNRGFANLVQMPHVFHGRNGEEIGTLTVPTLFLRRDFFANRWLIEQWLGTDTTLQSLRMWDDERLRIDLGGRIAAFTPDDPTPAQPNKSNHLSTEWVEYYFNVALEPTASLLNSFDETPYPAYPQMRRAKVFIDQLQQLAAAKHPSVVEFEDRYVEHLFAEGDDANSAKVILRHTNDFKTDPADETDRAVLKFLGGTRIPDPDIPTAWAGIWETFNQAGEKLGGLVNPNPALDRLSVAKSSLQLPAGDAIHKAVGLDKLDPRELFGRLDAELFAGIRLSDVMSLLEMDDAPQYLLNKVPEPFRDPSKLLDSVGANPIVRDALQSAQSIQAEITAVVDTATQLLKTAETQLAAAEAEVGRLKRAVEDELPTRSKIEAASHAWFESVRLSVFKGLGERPEDIALEVWNQLLIEAETQIRAMAVLELTRMLSETGADRLDADLAQFPYQTLAPAIDEFLADLKAFDATSSQYKAFEKEFHNLKANLRELSARYTEVNELFVRIEPLRRLPKPTPAEVALLEDLYRQLAEKVTLPTEVADTFTLTALSAFRFYELYKPRIDPKDQQKWRDTFTKLDALRRLNGNYYKARLTRLQNDAEDACRTLPKEVFDKVGAMQAVYLAGKTLRDDVIREWATSRVAAARKITDAPKIRADLEHAIVSTLSEYDPAKVLEERLRAAQKEIEENLRDAVVEQAKALAAAITSAADGLIGTFKNEFARAVADLKDGEAAQQAISVYENAMRILTGVAVQELKTEWSTSKLQSADIGFLQFIPLQAPQTTMVLKSGVRVEMDASQFPAVVARTTAYADSALTSFRIIFLNIIQIDFDRVAVSAGTGKSTNADVKIRSVQFTGSLSFIQKLEELLSGLVDGLRVELGADHVSVGYQSPSLDISSPGFTFSNFSVGVSLVVSFHNEPVRVRFGLAEVDRKATIAAGIYGGCFFCTLTLDTKRGIIGNDMALEMGAFFGLRFGPFHGHVKFMVGLRYTRDDEGVALTGYFIAEGQLSVWIITVSARLYMGIRSHNSVAVGFCIASFSVKVGFIKKTFRAGYEKRLAGATQNQSSTKRFNTLAATGIDAERPPVLSLLGGDAAAVAAALSDCVDYFLDDFQLLSPAEFAAFQRKHFAAV